MPHPFQNNLKNQKKNSLELTPNFISFSNDQKLGTSQNKVLSNDRCYRVLDTFLMPKQTPKFMTLI